MKEQTANRQPQIGNHICQACGAQARRRFARYCLDCGKSLREEYQPLDNLRSSYRLQNKDFQFGATERTDSFYEKPDNAALELAWAFLVYSMVPYLGILFTPGAIFTGSIGAINAYRRAQFSGVKSSLLNVALSVAVLIVQLVLWWLLYIIPELGRNFR